MIMVNRLESHRRMRICCLVTKLFQIGLKQANNHTVHICISLYSADDDHLLQYGDKKV